VQSSMQGMLFDPWGGWLLDAQQFDQ